MAKLDFNQDHIKHFRFKELFNELGWDLPLQQQPYSVAVGDDTWLLNVVAVKKGVQILHCQPDAEGALPDYATRQRIERKVTPEVREHLIVFTDAARTTQVWQWVNRTQGKTAQYREVHFRGGEAPELLTQKLSRLKFTLDEEELLTVLGVAARLDDAAPREKVTKKFYNEFEKQRKAFAEFIDGIPGVDEHLRWYTAVLIDRLMFLWFLQEKSFLDGNKTYLQTRLEKHLADGVSTSFYKSFLCPLFFRGFAEERTAANRAAIAAEFGNVPYLNGGLFAQHELETAYGAALDVSDAAFSKLFAFFDEWEWHLDERPLKTGKDGGKEINPDVLGYIFEKFVNQKQMGAYYTKEDITDYIGKNTIIPCLLGKVRAEHPTAFDTLAWPLLQTSGDDYIYPAMLKGVDVAYPADIEAGRDTEAPNLLERRKPWNKRADDTVSLPTEIWRETIARHDRTREVRAKLAAGDIKEVGDLITYNLNIRQFAQDLIERCTDVPLLKSFWFNLAGRLPRKANEKFRHGLSVLDPTCGSGAFLFAALGILKPLYDATLRTLQAVRTDALIAGEKSSPEKWAEVDELLTRFAAADSERAQDYAVIKHIIVNNLYGVDIEKQATEIAKLRLFLKLVSLLEPGDDIEPLPDIDFNIRHGNTLVGYATADETEKAVKGATQGNLFSDAWEDIRIRLTAVEQQYNNFQIQQVQHGGHVSPADKQALVDTLAELEEMLNYHLAREYGVNTTKTKDFEAWKKSHQPFHWYVDFYPLMAGGGFDVLIGNPPWLEFHKVEEPKYELRQYVTQDCGNLWAFVVERSIKIMSDRATLGMIVPMSLASTDRMSSVQQLVRAEGKSWISNFESDSNPGQLFDGVKQNVSIAVVHSGGKVDAQTTKLQRFFASARNIVFDTVEFETLPTQSVGYGFPKISSKQEQKILSKLFSHRPLALQQLSVSGDAVLVHRIAHYYIKCFDFMPFFRSDRDGEKKSEDYKEYRFGYPAPVYVAVINSSLFYFYWQVFFDAFKAGKHCIESFPFNAPPPELEQALNNAGQTLSLDLRANSSRLSASYKKTGAVEYDQFFPRKSKVLMDQVDELLMSHYSLSPSDVDFLISYDLKFRAVSDQSDD